MDTRLAPIRSRVLVKPNTENSLNIFHEPIVESTHASFSLPSFAYSLLAASPLSQVNVYGKMNMDCSLDSVLLYQEVMTIG
jgi:hypothetical protein